MINYNFVFELKTVLTIYDKSWTFSCVGGRSYHSGV